MYLKKMNGNDIEMLFDSPVMQEGCVQITKEEYDSISGELYILAHGTASYRGMMAKKEEFRKFRTRQFAAFDIYKSNVEYGVIEEDDKTRSEIISWYALMLEFPDYITEENYETIIFPVTPSAFSPYTGEINQEKNLAKSVTDLRKNK